MSKSYKNTIPIFLSEKQLKKHVNKIKTNLLEPGAPKDPENSIIFQLWSAFATNEQIQEMSHQFSRGIAWGEAKQLLFELINSKLETPREIYNELMANPDQIESVLLNGAERARAP